MLCTPKVTHIRYNKARLNCDADIIDFAELIILNLIYNAWNTNVSVPVLSRTDKQQIDSFVVKPRNIGR